MSTLVIVGAQWGDEGKGKVVDAVAAQADVVARFAGGNNAGHTLVVDGRKVVTHLVPSGCLYPGTRCVLGAGMVIDPDVLADEIASLHALGLLRDDELRVSLSAHVIFGYHRALDGAREDRAAGGARAIGTTRRGIGPAYEAKAARRGVQVRDLFEPELLRARLEQNRDVVGAELAAASLPPFDVEAAMRDAEAWAKWLAPVVCDTGALCHAAIREGRRVLLEGAQGALLDLDHGTYPYVTSSSTIAGGASSGLGIGPTLIDGVWGISKAYATRVGAGPFPTRLDDATGERLRQVGGEFGATTGRPRDCGWLDLPALRYGARLSGMTGLCITKMDVLAQLGQAQVCVAYEDGIDPGRDGLARARPQLQVVPGFDDPTLLGALMQARRFEELPRCVRAYLDLVAAHVEVPISLLSMGPDREQTVFVHEPFRSR
ncbi:MAG: adenylosuccinate synthase [Deltaproteobacteria bacterium]|nr:adenylosuccinate synthase [Deltaproteobacteria bacterium]MBP7290765.1 adenylosuccinate synthase [Nannocystaceae bacterium]